MESDEARRELARHTEIQRMERELAELRARAARPEPKAEQRESIEAGGTINRARYEAARDALRRRARGEV